MTAFAAPRAHCSSVCPADPGAAAPGPALAGLSREEAHIAATRFDRPTLVVDLDTVARQYRALSRGLGRARIHYAVKANPAPEIVARLARMGAGFDAASRAEIALCLAQGAPASRVSFGNTVKRADDIA